jgi:replicative DNA helicase
MNSTIYQDRGFIMQNDYLFPVFSLTDIASVTSRLNNSELIIIASRPSMGKTTLALIVATHFVINQEKPVAFISLEISKDLLLKRLPKTDKLTTRDIQNSSLYIDDTPNMTFSELEYALKNLQEEKHIKGVFIDYLGLLGWSDRSITPGKEKSALLIKLKTLAGELNIPIVALMGIARDKEISPQAINVSSDEAVQCIDRLILIQKSDMQKNVLKVYKHFQNNEWISEEAQ